MITVGQIYSYLDQIAPFDYQADWDNSGLQVGSYDDQVDKVLVALDVTSEVIEEAQDMGAQMIVSHHPVLFHAVKRLDRESIPYQLAKAGIASVACHTNLDTAPGGVNDCLASRLGLVDLQPLNWDTSRNFYKMTVFCPSDHTQKVYRAMTQAGAGTLGNYSGCAFTTTGEGRFICEEGSHPFIGEEGKEAAAQEDRLEMLVPPEKLKAVRAAMLVNHPYEQPAYDIVETSSVRRNTSFGLVGKLTFDDLSPQRFAYYVKEQLKAPGLRFVPGNRDVSKVAVLGGGGDSSLQDAIRSGADAFVTGECKHHVLLQAAEAGITFIDAGHFFTENVVVPCLTDKLKKQFPQVEFKASQLITDPSQWVK